MTTRLFLNALTISESSVCNARPRILSWVGAWQLSHFSRVWLLATLWTIARQASLSMGFSRQEYWSGLPLPSPGNLPTQGSNPHLFCLPHWQLGSLLLAPPRKSFQASLAAQWWRIHLQTQETQVWSLGWEDPLEKGFVTHPASLPGKSHGVRYDWATEHIAWDSCEHWFTPEPSGRPPEASSPTQV